MTFTIEPYVGPRPLTFEMTWSDVEAILGPATEVFSKRSRSELRGPLSLGYRNEDSKLEDAVFAPGSTIVFEHQDLLKHNNPVAFLSHFDPDPKLFMGFIVFLKLGIRVSGFRHGEDSQKAIGVVRRGYWDEYLDDFEEIS